MRSFPSTAQCLIDGEDARLHLDAHSGRNHYLCRPQAEVDVLRLGSSTASSISKAGFDVADRLRNQMADECLKRAPALVYADHAERITQQIRQCCGLDGGTKASTSIILTESGTATHGCALGLLREMDVDQAWCILMVDAAETGRGVPQALCPPGDGLACSEIAIRDKHGMPLSAAMIDADVVAQSERAIQQCKKVLLVMVDQSKSGCIAPSLSCALQLQQRFSGQLHLLLDACQFRIANDTLHTYLQHGVMVAITGSKFLAGPSFSAALFVPDDAPVLDSGLRAISSVPQPGLLLRWQVALDAWQSFLALDGVKTRQWMQQCAHAIEHRLANDNAFSRLAVPTLQRDMNTTGWDGIATIFPFMLRHPCSGGATGYADFAMSLAIYKALQQRGEPRIQLGRPIQLGHHSDGAGFGALRLCISAPMLVDAVCHQVAVIDQIMIALDRVACLSREMILNPSSSL